MPFLRFSLRAEADLLSIAAYTVETGGETQADLYIANLEDCCLLIADNPDVGRICDYIRPGLRRIESEKHVVFYRVESGQGVTITRILHQQVLPEMQAFEDERG